MIKIINRIAYAHCKPIVLAALASISLCVFAQNALYKIDPPAATPAPTASDSVSTPILTPVGNWIADTQSGCKVFTLRPLDGLSIEWTGRCDSAGQATGPGTVTYMRNGVKDGAVMGVAVLGHMEGKAELIAANGVTYSGELKEGRLEGPGTLTMPNRGVCNGIFLKGLLEGQTHCSFNNGGKYDGEFKAGQINGKGRFVEPNGDYYDGDFAPAGRNGHIVGQEHRGAVICKLEGEYRKNELYYGEISCEDGSTARGYFSSNRLTKGLITLKDGSRQEGEFDAQIHLIKSYPVTAPLTPEEQARFNNTLTNGKPAQIYYLAGQLSRQGHIEESDQLYQKLVDDYPDDVYTAKAIDRMDHADSTIGSRATAQSARSQEQHNSCVALCLSQSQQCNADAVSSAMPGATQAVTGAGSGNLAGVLSGLGSVLMNGNKDCDTPLRACKAACPP